MSIHSTHMAHLKWKHESYFLRSTKWSIKMTRPYTQWKHLDQLDTLTESNSPRLWCFWTVVQGFELPRTWSTGHYWKGLETQYARVLLHSNIRNIYISPWKYSKPLNHRMLPFGIFFLNTPTQLPMIFFLSLCLFPSPPYNNLLFSSLRKTI